MTSARNLCLALFLAACLGAAKAHRISILDYGARSGDGADDVLAIQAALEAATYGDTVHLPAGAWNVGGPLSPKSGITVLGTGQATQLTPSGTARFAFFSLTGRTNVDIGHLALKGGPFSVNGVKVTGGAGHHLHHLVISGLRGDAFGSEGIHLTSGVTGSIIADNILEDMSPDSEWGAGIRLSRGSSGNRILRNTVTRTGRGGILADNDSRRLVIAGNRITGSGLSGGGTGAGLGIEIWGGCDSSVIEDNEVDHWLSVDNSDHTAVRRNKIGTKDGTWKHCGLELVGSSHCVFADNVVDGGSEIGISVSNHPRKDYVYWARNAINGANTWGAQIQGDSGGAAFHFFYGNSFKATPKNHPLAQYPNQGHGVRFNANCRFVTVDSNEFSANGGSAVQWLGALESFRFVRNLISGNAGVAAGTFAGANLSWHGNVVSNNGAGMQEPVSKGAAPPPLEVDFISATSPGSSTVAFTNRTAGDGHELRYLWDFGEGLLSTEKDPSHFFVTEGSRRVTLVVWDAQGRAGRKEVWVVPGGTATRPGKPAPPGGANLAGREKSYPGFRLGRSVYDAKGRELGD